VLIHHDLISDFFRRTKVMVPAMRRRCIWSIARLHCYIIQRSCTDEEVVQRKVKGARCYGTRSPLKNIRARGRIIFLFFPRAARARAKNQPNQQCHFKSSRWRIELFDTGSCRGTVPMEPPMSGSSMRHREPIG
jgi:hypothetical protein